MALITKIKEYREKAGYKQSELAEMVGARRETIVHLENGKYNPSLKLAMDISKVFGVTVEELFEFRDEWWKGDTIMNKKALGATILVVGIVIAVVIILL